MKLLKVCLTTYLFLLCKKRKEKRYYGIKLAIFRSKPIYTLNDLAQIGSHNKREKKAYQSNKDIKIELSKNNIEFVPLNVKYVKCFDELTKEYKKEHEERMKTERNDRKKRYHEMLNSSKNVVADELDKVYTRDLYSQD